MSNSGRSRRELGNSGRSRRELGKLESQTVVLWEAGGRQVGGRWEAVVQVQIDLVQHTCIAQQHDVDDTTTKKL